MCCARKRLASSINGRFSSSVSSFHSAPNGPTNLHFSHFFLGTFRSNGSRRPVRNWILINELQAAAGCLCTQMTDNGGNFHCYSQKRLLTPSGTMIIGKTSPTIKSPHVPPPHVIDGLPFFSLSDFCHTGHLFKHISVNGTRFPPGSASRFFFLNGPLFVH